MHGQLLTHIILISYQLYITYLSGTVLSTACLCSLYIKKIAVSLGTIRNLYFNMCLICSMISDILALKMEVSVRKVVIRTAQMQHQTFTTSNSQLFDDSKSGEGKTLFFNLLPSAFNLQIRKVKCWDSPLDILYSRAKKNSVNSLHLQHSEQMPKVTDSAQEILFF